MKALRLFNTLTKASVDASESKALTVQQVDLPALHMIFSGKVVADKPGAKVPGIDDIGPRLWAKCSNHPIIFWCSKSEEDAYKQTIFKDLIATKNFRVCNIEDHFCQRFSNPRMNRIAEGMYDFYKTLLSPSHDACSGNKGIAKAVFSFFIMATTGGWEIDTNVLPHPGVEKVIFPRRDKFCLPELQGDHYNKLDIFLKYGSELNKEKALEICEQIIKGWRQLKAKSMAVDSYEYYLALFDILNPNDRDLTGIETLYFGRHSLNTSYSCAVDEPKIVKVFWSTHHHKDHKTTGRDVPVLTRAIAIGHLELTIQLMARGAQLDPKDVGLTELFIGHFRSKPTALKLRSAICLLTILQVQSGLLEKPVSFSTDEKAILLLKIAVSEALNECTSQFTTRSFFSLEVMKDPNLSPLEVLCANFQRGTNASSMCDFLKAANNNKVEATFKEILIKKLKTIPRKFICEAEFASLVPADDSSDKSQEETLAWIKSNYFFGQEHPRRFADLLEMAEGLYKENRFDEMERTLDALTHQFLHARPQMAEIHFQRACLNLGRINHGQVPEAQIEQMFTVIEDLINSAAERGYPKEKLGALQMEFNEKRSKFRASVPQRTASTPAAHTEEKVGNSAKDLVKKHKFGGFAHAGGGSESGKSITSEINSSPAVVEKQAVLF